METLLQILETFGFPVFAFAIAVYALKYTFDKNNEQHEKSLAEIGKLAEAVNQNTKTLLILAERMEAKYENVG